MALALGCALPAASAGAADLPDTARARGSLRIAMEGTYPGFNWFITD